MKAYYEEGQGAADSVLIGLRPGSYVPVFRWLDAQPPKHRESSVLQGCLRLGSRHPLTTMTEARTSNLIGPTNGSLSQALRRCGSLTILTKDKSTLIYKEAKKERVEQPGVIWPDEQLAAVFKCTFKDGGMWDTTEYS